MDSFTYDEFYERVGDVLREGKYYDQLWTGQLPDGMDVAGRDDGHCLLARWETGGVSGGSCWESSDPQNYTTGNTPEQLHSLDKIMEAFCPQITLLKGRELERLIEEGEHIVREYYGNRTEYGHLYLPLRSVYDFLVDNNYIANPGPACAPR